MIAAQSDTCKMCQANIPRRKCPVDLPPPESHESLKPLQKVFETVSNPPSKKEHPTLPAETPCKAAAAVFLDHTDL